MGLLDAYPLGQPPPITVPSMPVETTAPQIVFKMVAGLQTGLFEAVLQRETLEDPLKEVLEKDKSESILVVT